MLYLIILEFQIKGDKHDKYIQKKVHLIFVISLIQFSIELVLFTRSTSACVTGCHGPEGILAQQQDHLEDPTIDFVLDIQLVQVDLVNRLLG
jgi:hypothetical protein